MKQSTANKIAICLGISFFIFLACLKASHTGRIPVIPPRIPNMENSMTSAIPAVIKTNKPTNNNSQPINNNTTSNTQKPSNTNAIKNDTGNQSLSIFVHHHQCFWLIFNIEVTFYHGEATH